MALFRGWHGKMVERAGHGGEGNVIDRFLEEATRKFLKFFDDQAENIDLSGLRAFFNYSYKVDDPSGQANWEPVKSGLIVPFSLTPVNLKKE